MPPILYRTIRPFIPMERGAFTRSSADPTSRAYPRHGQVTVYIKSLCSGRLSSLSGTDTITELGLYCQHLFLSLSYLLLAALWAGCPPCLESPSLLTDTGSHNPRFLSTTFFDFLKLFSTFIVWLRERAHWVSTHYHRSQVRTAAGGHP